MRPANEANNKRPTKPKTRSQDNKQANEDEANAKDQTKQESSQEAAKGRTQNTTTQPPTHYEPLRFVPEPQFGDLKRQEGSSVVAAATKPCLCRARVSCMAVRREA
jgi:hypothetical protein